MLGPRRGPELEKFWADVGGSTRDQTCIVGSDQNCTDRGELAGRGTKTMGAGMADTEVPVSEVGPRREAPLGLGSRGPFGRGWMWERWGDGISAGGGLLAEAERKKMKLERRGRDGFAWCRPIWSCGAGRHTGFSGLAGEPARRGGDTVTDNRWLHERRRRGRSCVRRC